MIFRWNVTYLSIFKDILEAVQIINNNNTTHYDLKWDNIVLDIAPNEISNYNNNNEYDNEKKIIIKIYLKILQIQIMIIYQWIYHKIQFV